MASRHHQNASRRVSLRYKSYECDGDTRSPTASNRRVIITRMPVDTTIPEVHRWFNVEKIEGVAIIRRDNYESTVIVQFKRPVDYTAAILLNNSEYRRHTIKVQPWKSKNASKDKYSAPSNRIVDKPLHPEYKRSRGRDRRRSRSPSSSPEAEDISRARQRERWGREHDNSSHNHSTLSLSFTKNQFNPISKPNHHLQRFCFNPQASTDIPPPALPPNSHSFGVAKPNPILPPVIASESPKQICHPMSGDDQPPIYTTSKIEPSQTVTTVQSIIQVGDLSDHLRLIIQIILQENTACNLSLKQINELIKYLNSSRQLIINSQQNEQSAGEPSRCKSPTDGYLSVGDSNSAPIVQLDSTRASPETDRDEMVSAEAISKQLRGIFKKAS